VLPPRSVLYLAFDACDREVVRDLAAAGDLPTFAHLFDTAAVASVEPPPGVYISANWPSFTTALSPDHHEYVCWVEVDPSTYEWVETSPPRARGVPFWHRVADAGHRVAVFDVPHTIVSPESSAVQVTEWGCHDRHLGTSASPPALLDELEAVVGRHPIGQLDEQRPLNFAPCDFVHRAAVHRTNAESVALWEELLEAADRKEAASLHLLDKEPWSLFASVFGEAHCTGHQLWAAHDVEHPRHDPTLVALIGDPVREMYRRLDAVLAAHLARAHDDTTVYIQLSHGMGPHYDGTHLLDTILRRFHEADELARGWRTRAARASIGRVPPEWQVRALGALSAPFSRYVDDHPPAAEQPWALPTSERRWFQVPNNALGAVRINLRGRESSGIVDPVDYDRTCAQLERWLREIVNIDSGEAVVHRVFRSDRDYERRPDDRLPDLFIEWNSNAPIERVYSPRIGTVVGHDPQWRTGDHRRHGLLLARGPGIEPGARTEPLAMMDVGPTLCAALGVELEGVDGRPAADLVPGPHAGGAATGLRSGSQRWRAALRRASSAADTVTRLAAEHRATRQLAEHVDVRERQLDARVNHAAAGVEANALRLRNLEREASVRAVTEWVRLAEVHETLTVSVVLPTRDRATIVPRALASVLAQSYARLELVVVDDGSTDETPRVLDKLDDERVLRLRTDGLGVCAARNVALSAASGDVIVYLDDDNVMTPWWCKAVVWGFTQRPDANVLYGARLIDDVVRARHEGEGAMPSIQFEPFDFDVLTHHNFTDMNVLAHRAGLPEAIFDETIATYGDWDIFWRLTRSAPPLELPVIGCHYSTDGDGRLSHSATDLADREFLRDKFRKLLGEP
jgi:predicted AlkP superfamily phosphohydrolase/phosphomutase